ncbi:MAG: alpha/beta hydrolase [Gemmatimonadaceae bacterium]|nr:alpha/beta hydrolase [Gemmatimonadaceae bacterium]
MEVLAPAARPRAVVLMAHGLNQRASALRPLAQALRDRGASVVLLAFRGHRRDDEVDPRALEAWREITWEQWREDWREATASAASLAATHDVPLCFVGFSLGALVHVYELASEASPPGSFARQVLLAPAIRIHPRSRLVRIFRFLGSRFLIPSLAPMPVRSHRGTSVAAYEALFRYETALAGIDRAERLRIPTVVLMDARDELVSESRLRAWITQHDLDGAWRIESVEKDRTSAGRGLRHYITDEVGLGRDRFLQLVDRVTAALALE